MKYIGVFSLLILLAFFSGCQSIRNSPDATKSTPEPIPILENRPFFFDPSPSEMIHSVEILEKTVTKTENNYCSLKGFLFDINSEILANVPVSIDSSENKTVTNSEGFYNFDSIAPGQYFVKFKHEGFENCRISIVLEPGDQVEMKAILSKHEPIRASKPIIYLYPEATTEVEVRLNFDGTLTTTYPKYPADGWKITAEPDGTLTDSNEKEFYALYWEGEPRIPLGMKDGFVVAKETTVAFLEEKLEFLGLSARESNEFIIFWLPILEQNNFNLIHFSGDEYLKQAELTVVPSPKTSIRVMMVFQGLDEEIDVPIQDLTPLKRTRKGFTLVEWGGQELPKSVKLRI